MKILILNPEKKTNYRISKDTSGRYDKQTLPRFVR
jgi:hypothetical protein